MMRQRQQQLQQRLADAAPDAVIAGNTRSKKADRGEVCCVPALSPRSISCSLESHR